jgi:hypothetical protein
MWLGAIHEASVAARTRLHRGSDVDTATLSRLQEESRALVRDSIGDVPEHVVRNYLDVPLDRGAEHHVGEEARKSCAVEMIDA